MVGMENLSAPAQFEGPILRRALRQIGSPPKASPVFGGASHRNGRPKTMLSRLSRDSSKDNQQSLRVIGRFCTIVLFFACWAAVRHWPHPLFYLSNMLKVAFVTCLIFALLRRERFAGADLNYWDEALAYIATAVLLDTI
jgi:hypothetical protein